MGERTTAGRESAIERAGQPLNELPEFRERLLSALDDAADFIECGVEGLSGFVPDWLLAHVDEEMAERFARAARELAEQIGLGLWDHSLPRCTADELLLYRCIDHAEWGAEIDDLDCTAEAEAAREDLLMDEDVLLFWMPGAEVAFATGAMDALPDAPSADPARWFDRFVTTGEDRAEP